MATHRLIHVTRTGNDTDGLAEFTNADTVLLPTHSSDPTGTTEGEMIYNSTDDKIKIYNGSTWEVVGNTTENIEDIVGDMLVTNGTHTGISFAYDDAGDGAIDATVSVSSNAILDADNDTKIQVDEGGVDEDKIRYDVAGTEVAVQDAGGIALTTNGGMFRHNQTQAATFTISSGEGTLLAGPVTITGTVTNNGTMVVI
jgi:hypothetical protein